MNTKKKIMIMGEVVNEVGIKYKKKLRKMREQNKLTPEYDEKLFKKFVLICNEKIENKGAKLNGTLFFLLLPLCHAIKNESNYE